MKPGTQIAYVPNHAHGSISHPDVEFGFVTSVNHHGDVFCRYWHRGDVGRLRTTLNSECTPRRNLVAHDSVPQEEVDKLMVSLGYPVDSQEATA